MAAKWLGDPIGDTYRKPEGWQPIDTAPKDRAVLVFSPSLGCVLCNYSKRPSKTLGYESDWVSDCDGNRLARQPTHWMPLPAPPEAQ
jgi:hypothetical protein